MTTRATAHEHAWQHYGPIRAPTGAPPDHTEFYVLACACGAVTPFPRSNYELTTQAFRDQFVESMRVNGWRFVVET